MGGVDFSTVIPGKKSRNPDFLAGKKAYVVLCKCPTFLRVPGVHCTNLNMHPKPLYQRFSCYTFVCRKFCKHFQLDIMLSHSLWKQTIFSCKQNFFLRIEEFFFRNFFLFTLKWYNIFQINFFGIEECIGNLKKIDTSGKKWKKNDTFGQIKLIGYSKNSLLIKSPNLISIPKLNCISSCISLIIELFNLLLY